MKNNSSSILQQASAYVSVLLKEQLSENYFYHNFHHTYEVVNNAAEIAGAYPLHGDELEILFLAAWFHDTGHTRGSHHHEESSIQILKQFFTRQYYPEKKLSAVINCIKATRVPQKPKTLLEQILCDADLLYLGKKNMIEQAELLRLESELLQKKTIPETEWLKQSMEFINHHHYHTAYAIKKYEPLKQKNLRKIQRYLSKLESTGNPKK